MTDCRMVLAWQHHLQREYAAAETVCRRILGDRPGESAAWRLLGEACLAQGKHGDAAAAYHQARRGGPLALEDLNNLGVALMALGKPAEAEAAYRQALSLHPDSAGCLGNLGTALVKQEMFAEAAACFRRALAIDPGQSSAYHGLAYSLIQLEQAEELLEFLAGRLRENPNHAEVHHALGMAQAARRDWDAAVNSQRRALELQPDFAPAHYDLGYALVKLDRIDEAVASTRRAVALNPGTPEFWKNLGTALARQGKPEEALHCYEQVLKLNPEDAVCRIDLATTRLQLGDFERGWAEYAHRPDVGLLARQLARPLWDGSPLNGRGILLIAEQGLGDTIQFVRYASMLKRQGGRVTVACQQALLPLLESCPGIDRLAPRNGIPQDYDVFAPLMSLPELCSTTLDRVPAQVPYLDARAGLVESWRAELRPLGRFLVGVSWQGNPEYGHDRLRSFPLAQLEPLAQVPGVVLISLQKGPGVEQIAELGGRFPIVDLSDRIDRESGPFQDTAAIMKNLDLVIGCDSAIVHLAGALGVPVWVAHAFVCDWRWLLDRDDSPWYPTARLFRPTRPGDWEGVFARMADSLSERMKSRPAVARVSIDVAPAELLDKITILEIKNKRITDPAKLRNIREELAMLAGVRDRAIAASAELDRLVLDLKAVNLAIWRVEDELRLRERRRDFGRPFIDLARSVYRDNDRRAAIKREINDLLGSAIIEEKGYTAYDETRHDAA